MMTVTSPAPTLAPAAASGTFFLGFTCTLIPAPAAAGVFRFFGFTYSLFSTLAPAPTGSSHFIGFTCTLTLAPAAASGTCFLVFTRMPMAGLMFMRRTMRSLLND
ncbi:hypothetical protein [Gorillibacterium sp. sgz5001074]|uniref:hypothetical protein n=1 Tax=Gorillibacterium sp. sgz5001074 TaxID=3446695 RepID=UPI003F661589